MAIPAKLGQFTVLRELGRGGMGIVYLARDEKLKREVAIKTLPQRKSQDPHWRARFTREAELLARLSHPNIALIYEWLDVEEAGSFLVLEYVPGEGLRERILRRPLDVPTALDVCAQVARAMESAHNRGIIHRDLKPENLRLTPDEVVKILDFGIAVARASDDFLPPTAQNGDHPRVPAPSAPTRIAERPRPSIELDDASAELIGTPGYMSPEQARGRSIDKRTDVFAFGCILFECLSGRPAFDGATMADRIAAVLQDEPDWAVLPRDTPESIRSMLPRLLEKNLTDRLRDLGDARIEIEAAMHRRHSTAVSKPTPHNLPGSLTTFIGAEETLDRLRALLSDTRLLTLTGAGGCGKTRLALRLAMDSLPLHPDGVWIIELAPVTAWDGVLKAAADAVGFHSPDSRATQPDIVEHLRNGNRLLVFDNCEHLLSPTAQIVDALLRGCPEVKIITTSQEPLGLPGELVFKVPSLTLPGEDESDPDELRGYESVRLFVDRAKLASTRFELTAANAPAIARICRRLDGIPLAIELAAARVKVLTPDQIDAKLSNRFQVLTGGSKMAVERQRTLLGAMEWSYSLLDDHEKRFLRILSVFSGGCTLEAATAVCAISLNSDGTPDEIETLDMLSRLVDKSLVQVDDVEVEGESQARYRLLQSVRQFAASRLSETEDHMQARARHCDYYLDLCENAAANLDTQPKLLHACLADQENIITALRHAFETGGAGDKDVRFQRAMKRLRAAAPQAKTLQSAGA